VEVGGASGQDTERQENATELMDVHAAPDGGQSRLSMWEALHTI
jgi:hypothetical protein